jgi:glyoxylase-like metal-dependent hydrolase (beta-lactamase superfamily II)
MPLWDMSGNAPALPAILDRPLGQPIGARRHDVLVHDAVLIDVLQLGNPGVIAVYALDGPEPALVDCGPAVCVDALVAGLDAQGIGLTDLRHLLVTHIHPDHVGGAGRLVREHPGLQVHVHELGAPHLVDPARLEQSARRLYGDEFDRLFGAIEPVPPENVSIIAGPRLAGLDVIPTPGHAPHHVTFFGPDGACYPGDTLGACLPPGRFVYPASAPPGIDVDAWLASLDAIEAHRASVLRLAHFGEVADVTGHLDRLRSRIAEWRAFVADGGTEHGFVAMAEEAWRAEAGEAAGKHWLLPSFALSYAGLARFVEKRAQS